MFQFARFPSHILYIQMWMIEHYPNQVSQFGDLRVKALASLPELIAAARVLRRPVCQGIPHVLLLS